MIDRRFIGFLVVGGINTLFGYGAYGAFVLAGMVPHAAVACGTVAGILFNFLTTGTLFRSRDPRLLPRFVMVYAVMLAINMILLDLVLRTGVGPLIAQALVLPLLSILTFLAMRRFVFAASPEQAP